MAVSYTHLDVYKRQVLSARMCDVAGSDVSLYTVGGFAEAEDLALYTL